MTLLKFTCKQVQRFCLHVGVIFVLLSCYVHWTAPGRRDVNRVTLLPREITLPPSACVATARIENGKQTNKQTWHEPHHVDCLLVSSVVCLKENDMMVSNAVAVEGGWEREEVGLVIRVMRAYTDAVFVGKQWTRPNPCKMRQNASQ